MSKYAIVMVAAFVVSCAATAGGEEIKPPPAFPAAEVAEVCETGQCKAARKRLFAKKPVRGCAKHAKGIGRRVLSLVHCRKRCG